MEIWTYLKAQPIFIQRRSVSSPTLIVWNKIFTYSWKRPGKKCYQEKSRRNNFTETYVNAVFSADSKYNICLKSSGDCSLQKPLNISQKWHKLGPKSSISAKVLYCTLNFKFKRVLLEKGHWIGYSIKKSRWIIRKNYNFIRLKSH